MKKDLTGLRFGKLTVIREADTPYRSPGGKAFRRWICRCDCGNETTVTQNCLTASRNGTKSCGCSHADAQIPRRRDIIGEQRFGRLTVIGEEKLDIPEHNGNRRGLVCLCDCGNEVHTTLARLLSGLKSCGCLLSDTAKKKIKDGVNGSQNGTNLRLIDPERPPNKNNKLGIRGVYPCGDKERYRAKIGFKNRTIELGRFDTKEEALKARKNAEEKYFKTELKKHEPRE